MGSILPGSLALILVILFVFVVLVVAAVAVGAFALSRSGILGGSAPERTVQLSPQSDDDALDIVRQRYARGEITRDEYEYLRKDLET